MKFAVITDTSAVVSEKYKHYDNLHIMDIPVALDGVSYKSGEIADDTFYDLMENCQDVPTTSQPPIFELANVLKNLQTQGYTHVLGLFMTSGISSFYANACYLQDEFAPMIVNFPDTFITSSPLGYMVETALSLAQAGKSWEEILAVFEKQKDGDSAYMLVDNLKWLSKSGRLSNGTAVLGTLLNIKPVLTFSADGKIDVFEKVRTVKKATKRLEELLLQDAPDKKNTKLYVIHARNEVKAQELYDYAKEQGYEDVEIVTFGSVIATHLGLGAVAYAMTPKIEI